MASIEALYSKEYSISQLHEEWEYILGMSLYVTSTDIDPVSLLSKIQLGCRESEQKLVKEFWRGLYFILVKQTKDPDLSADLAQDTFFVVLKKARQGEITSPEALPAFIRQVGINLLIAHSRKEKRQATDSNMEIQIPDESPSHYRQLASSQALNLIKQLISELKVDRDKEILQMYYIEEKTKQEICKSLKLEAKHFDRVLHRARARLKQLIDHRYKDSSANLYDKSELYSYLLFLFIITPAPDIYDKEINGNILSDPLREFGLSSHFNNRETDFHLLAVSNQESRNG